MKPKSTPPPLPTQTTPAPEPATPPPPPGTFVLRLPAGGYLHRDLPAIMSKLVEAEDADIEDFSQALALARGNPPFFLPKLACFKLKKMAAMPLDSAVALLRSHAHPPPTDAPEDHGLLWGALLLTPLGFAAINDLEHSLKERMEPYQVVDHLASLPEDLQHLLTVTLPPPIDDFPQQPTPAVIWYTNYAADRIARPDDGE